MGEGALPGEESGSIHSFINRLSMGRPWPIGQLRPPDTPGLIKKARDNGITGQINDPLMKSPTKQAKTARPTYVFHHAVALAFPLAQPPRQAQLGRGRHRERGAEPEKEPRKMTPRSDTAEPPSPPEAPFRLLAEQKHLLPYCAAQTPLNTHTCTLRPGPGASREPEKAAPGPVCS